MSNTLIDTPLIMPSVKFDESLTTRREYDHFGANL